MNILIRKFIDKDASSIAEIMSRNFLEVNAKHYPIEEMEELSKAYDSERIKKIADNSNMYVAILDDEVVGAGSIMSFWGSLEESILRTIFVLPELHGKGIGRLIMNALESDEIFLRARRIEIPASITACEFYIKMGYEYKNGVKELDDEGHYRLEKVR